MAHALRYTKHVFCLEGEMSPDLRDKSSVHAALIFLQQNFGIRFIFKTVCSKGNLRHYINQWGKKKYAHYSICYLSFHGEKGCIELGDKLVYLDELARMLKGKCRNKIIHFGSCSTLKIDKKELEVFLKKGQSRARGAKIAQDLMRHLGISKSALLTGAYADLRPTPKGVDTRGSLPHDTRVACPSRTKTGRPVTPKSGRRRLKPSYRPLPE